MTGNEVSLFTSQINGLLPLDNDDNVSKLIRIIARQIKKSTFRLNLDKLEDDLLLWTKEELKPRLTRFFKRARINIKGTNQKTEPAGKTLKESKQKRKKNNQTKKQKPQSPTRPLPKVKGVPESLIKKSLKNEEKRKQRSLNKKEITRNGPPKRARWNKKRIVIGIYKPSMLHSETEEDPIHRK